MARDSTVIVPNPNFNARESGIGHVDHTLIVVGGGLAGIGVAIALDKAGLDDYVIVDDGDGPGGTWRWNRYPGVAVDTPIFSYQFSFAQQTDWSQLYAAGNEILAYAERLTRDYGLKKRMRFGTHIDEARWDDFGHRWQLRTDSGETLTARFLINAVGPFSKPIRPDITGIESFAGSLMHTARWDEGVELAGRRVGVIGTGASAVQLIPAIAAQVSQLVVFQRTPVWCLPRHDAQISPSAHRMLRATPVLPAIARLVARAYVELAMPIAVHYHQLIPITRYAEWSARRRLQTQVKDRALRDALTPRYPLGCKRPGFSNDYWPTYNRENVTLETEAITKATREGVSTVTGRQHNLDVLILATGFRVLGRDAPAFRTYGSTGQELGAHFEATRYRTYEGTSVPEFPNMFMVFGPYGYNGGSYFDLIEAQAHHIVRALLHADREGATRIKISRAATKRYAQQVIRNQRWQLFRDGGCDNAHAYYLTEDGDAPLRPQTTPETYWRARRYELSDYELGYAKAGERRRAADGAS